MKTSTSNSNSKWTEFEFEIVFDFSTQMLFGKEVYFKNV